MDLTRDESQPIDDIESSQPQSQSSHVPKQSVLNAASTSQEIASQSSSRRQSERAPRPKVRADEAQGKSGQQQRAPFVARDLIKLLWGGLHDEVLANIDMITASLYGSGSGSDIAAKQPAIGGKLSHEYYDESHCFIIYSTRASSAASRLFFTA